MFKKITLLLIFTLGTITSIGKLNKNPKDLLEALNENFPDKSELTPNEVSFLLFSLYTDQNPELATEIGKKAEDGVHISDEEAWWHTCYIVIEHYIETLNKESYSRLDISEIIMKNEIPNIIENFYEDSNKEIDVDELKEELNEMKAADVDTDTDDL